MATQVPESSEPQARFTLAPYAYADARALARELDLPEPVAVALVRRGHRTPELARAFLDADERHDPALIDGMAECVERIRAAISARRRITVHGDYDVDGVSSTAVLVGALTALGATVDWYIPSRLEDGYGLTASGVERLAARGTELLITVDCGVACPDEVRMAAERGIEVIVTDHHQPGDVLPECLVIHPELGGYPCAELCATGVAYKVSEALRGREADADLDLVALATVADLVPLHGENRTLVRRGLELARRAPRPGLRALMASASVEPERLDEGDLSFRLAPRINAAGRLYRADAGVELMLTQDPDRAGEIAAELESANSERRATEREVVQGAEAALRELPDGDAAAPALVLAGDGWHPGVVGICASRMVERTGRPVVLVSIDEDGRGRGSGRSVPGFDLLSALRACSEHLARFGGHRAAAGLELDAEAIPDFRRAFAEHAAAILGDTPPARAEEIDAVVGAEDLGMDVARGLERLGPFGKGNPPVRLVVPAARLREVEPMGDGDRHARFSLEGATARARGVAFGVNGSLAKAADAGALDISLSLELNHWNGSVSPRVVLGELYAPVDPVSEPVPDGDVGPAEWSARVRAELDDPALARVDPPATGARRAVVDKRGRSGVATVAALASSGEPVLVLCADATRRRALVERAAVPARFGGGEVAVAAGAGADAAAHQAAERIRVTGGVVLADWARLARNPGLAASFEHVVVIDPPPLAELEALVDGPSGFMHLAWGEPEVEFSLRVWDAAWPSRLLLASLYRALRAAGERGHIAPEAVRLALEGEGGPPRSPEVAGRVLRVLAELDLVRARDGGDLGPRGVCDGLSVVSSGATDLARSKAFGAYRERCEEGRRFLSRRRQLQ